MKKIVLSSCILFVISAAYAQTPAPASFAKSLGIYVFPAKNQPKATQDKDDAACYKWAVEQSGVDPINPPKIESEKVDRSADGSAVVGAARGAAAGVAIGAIGGVLVRARLSVPFVERLRRYAKVVGDAQQQRQNDQKAAMHNCYDDSFKKRLLRVLKAKVIRWIDV